MTDFVLEQFNLLYNANIMQDKYITRTKKYCDFLKQPLELWMFVPCVDNEPFNYSMHGNKEHFEQAKERCLFDGFVIRKMEGWNILDFPNNKYSKDFSVFEDAFKNMFVEDLVKYNLQLSQTAIKQIGL